MKKEGGRRVGERNSEGGKLYSCDLEWRCEKAGAGAGAGAWTE